jgi:hypothetical protein
MRRRAKDHAATARRLHLAEIIVAAFGIVLTAAAAALGEQTSATDLSPFIGVVTTVSAALVAHLEAGRYQFIAATYRVTAKRLENTLGRFDPDADNLQQFVEKCETIMAEENSAWMAKHVRA